MRAPSLDSAGNAAATAGGGAEPISMATASPSTIKRRVADDIGLMAQAPSIIDSPFPSPVETLTERATLQARTSSMTPAKKPSATPAVVKSLRIAVGTFVAASCANADGQDAIDDALEVHVQGRPVMCSGVVPQDVLRYDDCGSSRMVALWTSPLGEAGQSVFSKSATSWPFWCRFRGSG